MAFSEMSSRERTTIIVLAVVIGLAVIGIGVLAAKFLVGGGGQKTAITVPAPTTESVAPSATVTLAADVAPDSAAPDAALSVGADPVAVAQVKSLGPLVPAMLTLQPLDGRRQYKLEIAAENGSAVRISGDWSQTTTSAGGKIDLSLPAKFEGETPWVMDLDPGIDNPKEWNVSVSASPDDLLGDPPLLVITIWDITGIE